MRRPLLIGILALGLFACSEDDSVTGSGDPAVVDTLSIAKPSSDSTDSLRRVAARFAVVDTVVGSWKVAPSDGMYAGFSVQIGKDSLIWQNAWMKILRPDGKGKRFYAHGGLMGLTDGVSASDSVLFEYFKCGDTLWMEFQPTSTSTDGKLDRGSWFSHALLPAL